jgi:hypothetical protein
MIKKYAINNYMFDDSILGIEEDNNKIKGIAEFSFSGNELPEIEFAFDIAIVKKQEPIITINDDRRNRNSRKSTSLF